MVPDTASRLPLIETRKKKNGVCAADLQSSNHTYATRKTKFPFKSPHTPAAISGAHRQVSVITPGSIRSLQRFSTVREEKNTLKVDLGFCFTLKKDKKNKKTNMSKWCQVRKMRSQ